MRSWYKFVLSRESKSREHDLLDFTNDMLGYQEDVDLGYYELSRETASFF